MNYKLLSLNVGRPEVYATDKGDLESAYRKKPVSDRVPLSFTNLAGDEQADKKNHGGRDKALCLYPAQHYRHWESHYGHTFSFPSFGKNLTVEGIQEAEARIGDIYQLGSAVVQVSEPRKPCYIIARTHGIDDFPARVIDSGFTGFYLRVLKEGEIAAGDMLALIEAHPEGVTVSDVNDVRYGHNESPALLERIIRLEPLAEGLKQNLRKKLL
ncbi:MOSC domain-containing protein [Bacillus sp. SB49]|uniref:MOSC domain-containing protein n=1 Tax=Bacillus sp. SB49 TaxID=1071080 RepID=UPI00138B1124|nr:MOSC domain-containing protein [Bacillus sp. SB49]QHT45756.1 MOSC domain-containing protein [Bacillus sp. SB49]